MERVPVNSTESLGGPSRDTRQVTLQGLERWRHRGRLRETEAEGWEGEGDGEMREGEAKVGEGGEGESCLGGFWYSCSSSSSSFLVLTACYGLDVDRTDGGRARMVDVDQTVRYCERSHRSGWATNSQTTGQAEDETQT